MEEPEVEYMDEGAPSKNLIEQEIKSVNQSLRRSREASQAERHKSPSAERQADNPVVRELKYLRDTQRNIFGNPVLTQLLQDDSLSKKTLLSKFTLLENNLNRLIKQ